MKEKAVEWVKNKWLIAFVIIGVLMFIARKPLAVFIGWLSGIDVDDDISAGDLLRSFILLLGVIGGGYGLYLSTKRQKTFSDQVQVQVNQGFNDRLGRGVELLTNDDTIMQSAGFEVLQDLVDNANDRQKLVIARIVYNIFRDKALIRRDQKNNYSPRSEEDTTQDLQNALSMLINLPLSVQKKLKPTLQNRLDFSNLDFSHLHFGCKKLERIDFSHSCFDKTIFYVPKIVDVVFSNSHFITTGFTTYEAHPFAFLLEGYYLSYKFGKPIASKMLRADSGKEPEDIIIENVDIERTKFDGAIIENTEFIHGVRFIDADFYGTSCKNVMFTGVQFIDTNFNKVAGKNIKFLSSTYFLGGGFSCVNEMKFSDEFFIPQFIGTFISYTKFDFADEIEPSVCFETCCFSKGNWPSDEYNPMDSDRECEDAYTNWSTFIPSNKHWSGQPARQWVAVECAQWTLDQTKQEEWASKEDIDTAKKGLKEAKKNLRDAQKQLGLSLKIPEPISTPKPKAKSPKPKPTTKAKKPKPKKP